jgi:dTDP-D-glucose 4,6-dehydratase
MMDYHRQDGVDIRIARIFNTYGPRMDEADGRVVSNFIVQALRGEPLTLYGTGDQTRSFCYVDDLVDGLIRLMNAEGVHEPINLGNPHEFTVRELAVQITELCGTQTSVQYCALPQDDPAHRRPDITRAQLMLNWTPKVELREGLERTIADFEDRLTRPEEQGSCVRATLRRALQHSNGKQARSGAAVEHSNGKHDRSGAAVEHSNGNGIRAGAVLSQPFFERAELAVSSDELAADFEGLWIR